MIRLDARGRVSLHEVLSSLSGGKRGGHVSRAVESSSGEVLLLHTSSSVLRWNSATAAFLARKQSAAFDANL